MSARCSQGAHFVIWAGTQRLSLPCSGWLRPYACQLTSADDFALAFVKIDAVSVTVHQACCGGDDILSPQRPAAPVQELLPPHHGRELLACSIVHIDGHAVAVSASEDGTVRALELGYAAIALSSVLRAEEQGALSFSLLDQEASEARHLPFFNSAAL